MNREQQERVEELGNALAEAVSAVRDMDGGREVVERNTEPAPQPTPQPTLEQVPHMRNKANYSPEIAQVNNGFIVTMGCQRFVFETYDKMSKYLKMYFEDPMGTESKFNANELFK